MSELRSAAKRWRIAFTKYELAKRDFVHDKISHSEMETARKELRKAQAEWELIKAQFKRER